MPGPGGQAKRHIGRVRFVGLLRGVNLGRRQLKMSDLRAVVESLGHTGVKTYLQSGNVVFEPTGGATGDLSQQISDALYDAVGLRAAVQARTAEQMAQILAANPYDRDDPTKVMVTFLAAPGRPPNLDLESFAPEGLTVHGTEIYFDLPSGLARSKLLPALAKVAPDDGRATSRNWRTVVALARMTAE